MSSSTGHEPRSSPGSTAACRARATRAPSVALASQPITAVASPPGGTVTGAIPGSVARNEEPGRTSTSSAWPLWSANAMSGYPSTTQGSSPTFISRMLWARCPVAPSAVPSSSVARSRVQAPAGSWGVEAPGARSGTGSPTAAGSTKAPVSFLTGSARERPGGDPAPGESPVGSVRRGLDDRSRETVQAREREEGQDPGDVIAQPDDRSGEDGTEPEHEERGSPADTLRTPSHDPDDAAHHGGRH
ncbi:unnamed protein product, partial [Penicillium discolor]